MSSNTNNGQTVESSEDHTRRRFLKGTATAGVAAAGVTAGTSGVAAQWFGGGSGGSGGTGGTDPENASAPTFDVGSLGASQLPESDAEELVVYLHGASAGDTAGSQAGEMRVRLGNAGYDTTVVAGVFNEGDVGIGEASGPAADHLSGLIEDYMDSGGTVHIVGYSLGGILTYQTVNALGSGYTVDSASTLGTGTPDDTVCEGNVYYDGLQNNAQNVCILTSDNDSAVSAMSGAETGCGGFGGGSAPSNLEQVDVTSEVDSHLAYLDSSLVHEELADCFESGSGTSGSGSGSSGTSGESGSGWWGSDSGSSGTFGSSGSDGFGWW